MREMKDSGHETIGLVPSDWTEKRLKYLCKIQTGNEDTQNANPDGKYPFYVRSPIVEHCDRYTFDGEGILVAGDGAGAGRIFHHVYGKYAVHQRVYRLSHFAGNADFIYYYLSNLFPHEMDKGSAQSTVPSMRLPMLLNFPLFLPSKKEQDKIVTFLDSKCSEIDAISADIQKEIETLEQYKRSVITEAVTKGLNPDVEMKDSGIEWVGNIPAHWDAIPIRYLFAECRFKNTLNQEKTALKFTYGTIIKKTNFDSDSDEYVANTMANYTLVNPGTIMINGLNLNYDFVSQRVGLVKDRGAITSAYLAIAPGNRVVSEYANYQLKSWDYAKAFHNMGTGVRKTLDFSELGKKYFVTPSIEEQSEIVTFLDSKCKEIESIIESKKQQLTVIDSYKKSLIYEYVTGKKEVPLYES